MTIRRSIPALSLSLCLLLAACGGESGPSFEGSVDAETAALAADDAGDFVTTTLDAVFGDQWVATLEAPTPASGPTGVAATARDWTLRVTERMARLTALRQRSAMATRVAERIRAISAVSSLTCVPDVTGVDGEGYYIDDDGDYMPDDLTVDYGSGCSESQDGLVITLSGKYRIRDTGTGFASYAFTATHWRIRIKDGSSGDYIYQDINGTEDGSWSAALADHQMDLDVTYVEHFSGHDATEILSVDESSSYDPDVGQSFTLFGALPSGLLTYDADYRLIGENSGGTIPGNFRFQLETPSALHFTTACGGITGGTLGGYLNGGDDVGFTLQWTSCADPVVTFFGIDG